MKALIEHLWRCNREQIVARSLMHCHAWNVHSIMLLECPGKTIRLFVAEPGHLLAENHPAIVHHCQTVGFHAHHCELTLQPVFGEVFNWTIEKTATGGFTIPQYRYQSAITHGAIAFKADGDASFVTKGFDVIPPGEGVFMRASEIHTIVVRAGQWAAWLAFEGRENPEYDNRLWSYTRPEAQDYSKFYRPMTPSIIRDYLKLAFRGSNL